MIFTFGEWIRKEREKRRLTQSEIVNRTNNVVCQSALSQYERNEIKDMSIVKLLAIVEALEIPISEIPWGKLMFSKGSDNLQKERLNLYELPAADSVRTFDGKTYKLVGFVGVEESTGKIEHVTDIYYRARTVVAGGRVFAKRKHPEEELTLVTTNRKVGS